MVGTTASYFSKMTNLLNEICKDIAENIINLYEWASSITTPCK